MAAITENLQFTREVNIVLKNRLDKESFSALFILVDENTETNCLPLILTSLPDDFQLIRISAGEVNKTLATCELIWQALTDARADREALLINLGGGVICDMGGFCARTYKRGIRFWNVPTTLLSQVDASVGGKLGIDFGAFKNQIGLFSEPDWVIFDPGFFNTLPNGELVSGFAEMVKHGLISDREMFNELARQSIASIDWHEWVQRSVAIKSTVVKDDPLEKGLRKVLNFGHTIGHAIESYYLDTAKSLKHGEAIAIGMLTETFLAQEKGLLAKEEALQVINFLIETFPRQKIEEKAINPIIELALQDKKNKNGKIKAVLLNAIGEAVYDIEISADEIRLSLAYYNKLLK